MTIEELAKWHEESDEILLIGASSIGPGKHADRYLVDAKRHRATAALLRELAKARRVIEFNLDPDNEDVSEYDHVSAESDRLLKECGE